MLVAVYAGGRRAQDHFKGLDRLAFNLHHLGHRQARRVNSVQARGNQLIAGSDIGIGSHAHVQVAGLAAAVDDAAQTIARDLHRNSLVLVCQQRYFRSQREDARDLADHAEVVDHRLSECHPMLRSAVHDDLVRRLVTRIVQDFTHDGLDRNPLPGVQQFAQVCVFRQQL